MFFAVSAVVLLSTYLLTRRVSILWRASGVAGLIALLAFFVWVLEVPLRAAGQPWYETPPYKQGVALGFMVLGMAGKYLFDVIEARRQKKAQGHTNPKLEFDRWDFFQPFIISFMVFGAFWNVHGHEALSISCLVISFQNGFFWQTIL